MENKNNTGHIKFYEFNDELFHLVIDHINKDRKSEARKILLKLHTADLAHFISLCSNEYREIAVNLLRKKFNPEVLIAMDTTVSSSIIELLGIDVSANLLTKIDKDDAVYILEHLSQDLQDKLMSSLVLSIREALREHMRYREDSVGRIMDKKVISVMEYWTVGQTNDYLRYNQDVSDDFYEIFVVNYNYQPVGAAQASKLLCTHRDTVIRDIMNEEFKLITADTDQEEASYMFTQYDLSTAPVVNKQGRLIGSISVDDVVDIIEKEAEEDILHLGGISSSDIFSPIWMTAKHRLPWLIVHLLIAIIISLIIRFFEATISSMVIIASIMPIVTAMAGNAGTQTMTIAVRSIATKELTNINAKRVIFKEVFVSLINGFICAIIGAVVMYLWHQSFELSAVFVMSVMLSSTMSGFFGAFVPILLDRMGVDPAVSSSIFLTAIADALGFFVFLLLASLILV